MVTPTSRSPTRARWHLLARDKYLWFIAGMVILLNWVNSSGEYLLDRTLVIAARTQPRTA